MPQAASSSHLPPPSTGSNLSDLAHPSPATETQAIFTNVSGGEAICLGALLFLCVKEETHDFSAKPGPRWTVVACVQGQPAPSIRESLSPSVIELHRTLIIVGWGMESPQTPKL